MKKLLAIALIGILLPCFAQNSDSLLSEQTQAAMLTSMSFMRSIATHGGYAGIYSLDLQETYGEAFYETVPPENIWIQPPGTPSVGEAYLRAYLITGNSTYLEAPRDVGRALAWTQRLEGGWDHQGNVSDLEPTSQLPDRVSGRCTFDDDISQGVLRFLMNLDKVITEEWLTESSQLGINFFMDSQFENGAWPQWYPLIGGYHDYYTFNDNTINDCIGMMIKIHERYGDSIYLERIRKGGDFMILSQIAPPQAGWAQQYDYNMQPAWARAFEPPGVCSAVSSRNIRTLVDLVLYTKDEKYFQPIPTVIAWLDTSNIDDNLWARLYEVGTNVPIYGDTDGKVHYTLEEISEERRNGYSWQSSYSVNSNKNYYYDVLEKGIDQYLAEQFAPLTQSEKENLLSKNASKAQNVLTALDGQGRWLDSEGQWIYTADFVKNSNILCNYEEIYLLKSAGHDIKGEIFSDLHIKALRSEISIQLNLNHASGLAFKIYDISGKQVCAFTYNKCQSGVFKTKWKKAISCSGIYLIKISAGNYSIVRRINIY